MERRWAELAKEPAAEKAARRAAVVDFLLSSQDMSPEQLASLLPAKESPQTPLKAKQDSPDRKSSGSRPIPARSDSSSTPAGEKNA